MTSTVLILDKGFDDLEIERERFSSAGIDVVISATSTPPAVISTIESNDSEVNAILT